jgi:DNA-binding PadR family transcriptional regulator
MLSNDGNLAEMIQQLEADRRRHAEAIEAIDDVLSQVGRVVSLARLDPGDFPVPSLTLPHTPRRRGKFELTGERSVLGFISRRGSPTTAEINEHWRAEGRRGVANVILLKLLKQGLIQRRLDAGIRGSRYLTTPAGEEECRRLKEQSETPDAADDKESPVAHLPSSTNRLS